MPWQLCYTVVTDLKALYHNFKGKKNPCHGSSWESLNFACTTYCLGTTWTIINRLWQSFEGKVFKPAEIKRQVTIRTSQAWNCIVRSLLGWYSWTKACRVTWISWGGNLGRQHVGSLDSPEVVFLDDSMSGHLTLLMWYSWTTVTACWTFVAWRGGPFAADPQCGRPPVAVQYVCISASHSPSRALPEPVISLPRKCTQISYLYFLLFFCRLCQGKFPPHK